MESTQLKNIVEAALLAAGGPLTIDQLHSLFGDNGPEKKEIRDVIQALQDDYAERGIEIREVASGFRIQVRESMAQWLAKLFEDRPPRYTRALMETLAIVAYRQPVTRGDIEEIRGVSVSPNIIRTMLERDWIKVVGHRDVPGKPAIFGTTRFFLDYFGLRKLDDLPPLAELASLEPVGLQLELGTAGRQPETEGAEPGQDREHESGDQHSADEDFRPPAQAAVARSGDSYVADDAAAREAEDFRQLEEGERDEDDAVNIASLDDARAAAAREPETDFNAERAEVVPIKQK